MRKSYLPLTRNCLLLLLLCIPMGQAFADWYPAPIDYRQTMTVVVRETDVDDWQSDKVRYPSDLVVSANGSTIAFKVKVSSSAEDHIFIAKANGSGLTDITGSLPAGVAAKDLGTLQLNDNGSRLFFFHVNLDEIYYCDLAPVSCAQAVDNMFPGVPWIGKPYLINSEGTDLYFKFNEGRHPITKEPRLGIYTTGVGGAGGTPLRIMHIEDLQCSYGDCLDMYRLKLLGGSADVDRLLFRWDRGRPPPTYPPPRAMWMLEGGLPVRVPDEEHHYVWDGPYSRVVSADGKVALYEYCDSGNPVRLYAVDLDSGGKTLVAETTDPNWFVHGPSLSSNGKYARFASGRFLSTLADLKTGGKRDTWSSVFGESGCVGASNLTDLTATGRYYFMGSRCDGTKTAKIHRVDTAPTSFGNTPRITAIKFSQPALLKDGATTIVIAVTVSDSQGAGNIEWVRIHSLVDGLEAPEWLNFDPLSFFWPLLLDNGSNGDEVAGDGIYTFNAVSTTLNASNFYTRYSLPHDVGIRVVAKDKDGNYAIADTRLTVTNQALPIVSVSATDVIASEPGKDKGKFTVSRTGSTAAPLTVSYSLSGNAVNGTDYKLLSGRVKIPVGSATGNIVVCPLDDALVEGTETVKVTLINRAASYYIGLSNKATVTIKDNEAQ